MLPAARISIVFALSILLAGSAAAGFIYDFPGTPGSGVGTDQTNPEPGNATFGDWSRVNVSAAATANVYASAFWNATSVFDPTQYITFTITADAGYHLDLTKLTFDQMRTAGGSTHGTIELFLDGSTTAYASQNFNPTSSVGNVTFNFVATADAMNVSVAEFRVYAWNGGTPSASFFVDNVATTLTIVPETGTWLVALVPLALFAHARIVKKRDRR